MWKSGPRDSLQHLYTAEATTRDAFALVDTLEITVERPLVVDSSSSTRIKKREPKYCCHGGRKATLFRLASFHMPLILIGAANVDDSAILDTVCTFWLR